MTTPVSPPADSLDSAQRAWLKKMGAQFDAGAAIVGGSAKTEPAPHAIEPPTLNEPRPTPPLLTEPPQSGPVQAGNFSTRHKSTYEGNLSGIEDELEWIRAESPTDDKLVKLRKQVLDVEDMMRAVAGDGDYDQAYKYSEELLVLLRQYETTKQAIAKVAYESKYKPAQAELRAVLTSTWADAEMMKIHGLLSMLYGRMIAAANNGNYVLASAEFDSVAKLLAKMRAARAAAQPDAKKEFEYNFKSVQPDLKLAIATLPPDDKSAAIHKDLVDAGYQAEIAAKQNDYVKANEHLLRAIDLMRAYKKALDQVATRQIAAKANFNAKLARIKPDLDRILAEKPVDNPTKKAKEALATNDRQMQIAAFNQDYIVAEKHADQAGALIQQYRAARQTAEADPKIKYGLLREKIDESLKSALQPPRKDKFMVDLQKQVKTALADVDKAVAKKNFPVAVTKVQSLTELLKKFHEEDRKTPRDREWVLAEAGKLRNKIDKLYLSAQNSLDATAQAYDDALKEHRAALDAVKNKNSLTDALLTGLFFAGLGGVLGGAAAAFFKGAMTKAAADSLAGGAFLDGAKDTVKFLSRVKTQLDGKPYDDPLVGLAVLQGSGVELTRIFAKRLRNEKIKLLDSVEILYDLVQKTGSNKEIRIEGSPAALLDNDAVLKGLSELPAADKKGFANVIWDAWITAYAYKVTSYGQTIYIESQTIYYEVENDFDKDLIPAIAGQTGKDFNLYITLEKSKQKAVEKMQKMARSGGKRDLKLKFE